MLPRFILIKGAGDLATGVAHRLYTAGFKVALTEQEEPTVIRRTVSFAEAVFKGEWVVEGLCARRAADPAHVPELLASGKIPVLVDPGLKSLAVLKPEVFIEGTVSKKNTGVTRGLAPLVIALGPGYYAGRAVDAVVETARGHYVGRAIIKEKRLLTRGSPVM